MNSQTANNSYVNEPQRKMSQAIVHSLEPYNAEPLLDLLKTSYITSESAFFKRNHGPIPLLSPEDYSLSIVGCVDKELELKYSDITNNFQRTEILATLQCAGNRRNELNKIKKVKGIPWGPATISNAYWAGAKLCQVLKKAIRTKNHQNLHVCFEAYGEAQDDEVYGSSIPLSHAMNTNNDVLLAYEMNGKTLPRDHGYPIRVIVPGVIGARSVKHLRRIIVSESESENFYQQIDYKLYPDNINETNVRDHFYLHDAVQEFNVQSFIYSPRSLRETANKNNSVYGYAIAGGGRKVNTVELSFDNGKTWKAADLMQDKVGNGYWGWCYWRYEAEELSNVTTITCCATDSSQNTQPMDATWNYRGILNTSWDRIYLVEE